MNQTGGKVCEFVKYVFIIYYIGDKIVLRNHERQKVETIKSVI